MAYQYASTLYNTPYDAAEASVEDFLTACGQHSAADVATLDAAKMVAEIAASEWDVPYLDECRDSLLEMVRAAIAAAAVEAAAEDDDDRDDDDLLRSPRRLLS